MLRSHREGNPKDEGAWRKRLTLAGERGSLQLPSWLAIDGARDESSQTKLRYSRACKSQFSPLSPPIFFEVIKRPKGRQGGNRVQRCKALHPVQAVCFAKEVQLYGKYPSGRFQLPGSKGCHSRKLRLSPEQRVWKATP